MHIRIAALCGALLLVLTACPDDPTPQPDGGDLDAGIIPPPGGCTGGCGPHQICDEELRRCVSACQPDCGPDEICVEQGGAHVCEQKVTSCGGNTCGEGQAACVGDACTCLTFEEVAVDTCFAQGRLCSQPFNPVTLTGGSCEAPRVHQACNLDCTGPECACENGGECYDLVGIPTCWRRCSDDIGGPTCHPEEICAALTQTRSVCFPKSVFTVTGTPPAGVLRPPGRQCYVPASVLPDGGVVDWDRTAASDPCVITNSSNDIIEADVANPTGTCSWLILQGPSGREVLTYCRNPGSIPEGGACPAGAFPSSIANSCAAGLECVPQGRDGQGVCAQICNARPTASGGPGSPGCDEGEACVNVHRMDDPAKVPGACMQTCDVFSTTHSAQDNYGCADLGGVATACVPTGPLGNLRVTPNGEGLCLPRMPTVASVGQPCAETDAFRGAACDSGLVCLQVDGASIPTCQQPCDLECASATPPARCATQANATCSGTQTCTAVGTASARLGFCL